MRCVLNAMLCMVIAFTVGSQLAMAEESFPTSKDSAETPPWETMHEDGFTGSFTDACGLLGLGEGLCIKYNQMHSNGTECAVMDIPNGVVLNRLVFTNRESGNHTVQHRVPVKLENPPTRAATVCKLRDDLYVGRIHGCNNHFRVDVGTPEHDPTPVPPVPETNVSDGPCNGSRQILIHAWTDSTLPDDLREKISSLVWQQDTRETFNAEESSVSRTHGEEIRRRMAYTTDADFNVDVSHIVTEDGSVSIMQESSITTVPLKWGNGHVSVPESVTAEHHAVRIIVPFRLSEYAVFSPTQFGRTGKREIRVFWSEWDGCSTNVHIILKEIPN